MIGHHHEPIDFNARKPRREVIPQRRHHLPGFVEVHRTGFHIAEQAGSILRADGHEICSGHAVVVALEAKAATAMDSGVAHHWFSATNVTLLGFVRFRQP
jgi:hypothetical protein